MEKSKLFTITAIIFSVVYAVDAQDKWIGQGPDIRAEREKEMIFSHINDLTDNQKKEVDAIYASFEIDVLAARDNLKRINEEKEDALNELFTEKQRSEYMDLSRQHHRSEIQRHRFYGRSYKRTKRQLRQFNPKSMAQREKKLLYDSIQDLSEDQKLVIDEIYNQYGQDLQTSFDEAEGNRESMRAALQAVRKNKQDQLKEILTEEQWLKAEALVRQVRERRQARRPRHKQQ
jgi:hypothetical protein